MQVKRKNCQLFGIKNFKISKLKHKGLIDKISINQHETSAICLSFITIIIGQQNMSKTKKTCKSWAKTTGSSQVQDSSKTSTTNVATRTCGYTVWVWIIRHTYKYESTLCNKLKKNQCKTRIRKIKLPWPKITNGPTNYDTMNIWMMQTQKY